jgi:uncharacterized protein (TIGR04255 family)
MTFPRSPRVRYGHSPLVEVICQLRFPPILRIDRDAPVELQDALRADLPSYQRFDISPLAIVSAGQQVALPPENVDRRVEHVFLSADGQQRTTLGRDFVATSSLSYPGWEAFERYLRNAVTAIEAVYRPAHFVRVGLRYQNVIRRRELGLEGRAWRELLRPAVAGLLAEIEPASPLPFQMVTEAIYQFDGPLRARIAHGLVQAEDQECYLIDSDFFFEGQHSLLEVQDQLDVLHEQAGSAFRWCIQDALHEALQPEPV